MTHLSSPTNESFKKKSLLLIFDILSWETEILFKKPLLTLCILNSFFLCSVLIVPELHVQFFQWLICIDKELISFFCRKICHFLQNHLLKSLPLFIYIFYTFVKNWRRVALWAFIWSLYSLHMSSSWLLFQYHITTLYFCFVSLSL